MADSSLSEQVSLHIDQPATCMPDRSIIAANNACLRTALVMGRDGTPKLMADGTPQQMKVSRETPLPEWIWPGGSPPPPPAPAPPLITPAEFVTLLHGYIIANGAPWKEHTKSIAGGDVGSFYKQHPVRYMSLLEANIDSSSSQFRSLLQEARQLKQSSSMSLKALLHDGDRRGELLRLIPDATASGMQRIVARNAEDGALPSPQPPPPPPPAPPLITPAELVTLLHGYILANGAPWKEFPKSIEGADAGLFYKQHPVRAHFAQPRLSCSLPLSLRVVHCTGGKAAQAVLQHESEGPLTRWRPSRRAAASDSRRNCQRYAAHCGSQRRRWSIAIAAAAAAAAAGSTPDHACRAGHASARLHSRERSPVEGVPEEH